MISRTPSATRFVITPSPRLDAGRFDNGLIISVTRPPLSLSSTTEDTGDEQSTIIVDVINSFVVVNDGSTGTVAIDRVDWLGEHEADPSLAWAIICSRAEVYPSSSCMHGARSCPGVFGGSASTDILLSWDICWREARRSSDVLCWKCCSVVRGDWLSRDSLLGDGLSLGISVSLDGTALFGGHGEYKAEVSLARAMT